MSPSSVHSAPVSFEHPFVDPHGLGCHCGDSCDCEVLGVPMLGSRGVLEDLACRLTSAVRYLRALFDTCGLSRKGSRVVALGSAKLLRVRIDDIS